MNIIEVKGDRAKTKDQSFIQHRRQAINYRAFGVPVTFIFGMDDAKQFVEGLRG